MPSNTVNKANTNEASHSLVDMLERFIFIETFKWKSDSPTIPLHLTLNSYINSQRNYLKQYLLPQALFNASSLLRQKLNNFLLMKADVEIDVKVNSTPFQQGELLIAYFPRSLSTSKFRGEGSEFLAAVTSAPHRRLKLEQGNSTTFQIPYANIVDYINLTKSDNAFGTLNIYSLSGIEGESDAETVDITVRLRFVNIQLKVPTDNSILTDTHYRQKERELLADLPESKKIHGLTAQMSEGESTGPVTKISNAIATISETLSGVPLIGKAAGLIGWFARGVSGAAAVFGWSKPTDLAMPITTVARPAAFMGNTEGKDNSCVLAQIADNAIDSSSMIPSGRDEMALSTIFTRPNIVGRIKVPQAQFTQGNLMFSWEVSPFNYLTQQIASNGQDLALGSFSFASLMYKFWRGSIQYSLSAVKTQYHSARLMAVYFPNRVRSELPSTFKELMTTNSNMIFDLTAMTDDEFSLEKPIVVPYTSEEPWKKTLWKNENGLYDSGTLNTCVGTVAVYCINELVCPPTVSGNVTFLLSVQAGPDYELALPQIQLQGGFANASTINVAAEVISNLTNAYPLDQYCTAAVATTTPDLADAVTNPETTIRQSSGPTTWLLSEGTSIEVPDGSFTVPLHLNIQSNTSTFASGAYEFTVVVADGLVTSMTSDYLVAVDDITEGTAVSFTFAEGDALRAQMDDGASEPIASTSTIAQSITHSDVSISTTGEYCKSLRPLTKRFCLTRRLDTSTPVSLTPSDFNNYDSTAPLLPVGNRAWGSVANGALLPESWLNLTSYLYRFFSGSIRTKVFIPIRTQVTTSLDVTDTLTTEFDTPHCDPSFIVNGTINNVVETTLPYYGQYSARTIGDDVRGSGVKQRIEFDRNVGNVDYYEAAGDDMNMWFMIGPPIMRPWDVIPTPVPNIKQANTSQMHEYSHHR